MLKKFKRPLLFLVVLALAGQVLFAFASPRYTSPYYENRVYATTGIQFEGEDLHKLNEGAHYFGQTMIGWTKFPNFKPELSAFAALPEGTDINMHMQERQNIILTLTTQTPLTLANLYKAKGFLADKINEYNANTNTRFVLTNIDYELTEVKRTYLFGALFTLLLSGAIGLAILFIRKEFFPPKLKL